MSVLCRLCGTALEHTFVDLGMSPLCQKHVRPQELSEMEPFYPLHVWVCHECFLVQLEEFVPPEDIFGDGDYAYFSAYSDSWLVHARAYSQAMVERFSLNSGSRIIEIASNDGYLLQYFNEAGMEVLGIDPASNCAAAARDRGIETFVEFFGQDTARRVLMDRGPADLMVGNNVLAHVPDINDLVAGIQILLSPTGVVTLEFPHLLRLIAENQFDTIYHEHFSYLSFGTAERAFAGHGLTLFDVEELPTHGGSLRIFGRHAADASKPVSERVHELREREIEEGTHDLAYYRRFDERVRETKRKLLSFLIDVKRKGKQVVGYGAPGKGNTLLNYCGIRTDFLDYTVDRNPHKQGNYLPGTRIPIYEPERIAETRPDYVLILPWNLKDEIMDSMSEIRSWGGEFVVPIPEVRVY